MAGFSNTDATVVLGKLRPKQIAALIEILQDVNLRQISFVENIYNEQAENFYETLIFLKEIGWVHQIKNEIELTSKEIGGQIKTGSSIIEAIISSPNCFQKIFADYLAQFQVVETAIFYQPSVPNRLEQAAIRNFLIETEIIFHETENDSYVLNAQHAHLYLWARNIRGTTSKEEFLIAANQKDQLGAAAEIAAFEFEKKRIGVEWSERVEHVSIKNPGACFDIKSVSIVGNQVLNRFIEVKAVSADSCRFFWTAAEIEAARLLKESYFLYLLPTLNERKFDLSNIMIIQNPFDTVYQSPDKWLIEEKIVSCTRRK